jgi:hypothetical protein
VSARAGSRRQGRTARSRATEPTERGAAEEDRASARRDRSPEPEERPGDEQYRVDRNGAIGADVNECVRAFNGGGIDMDPKMIEINNLRVLNDYLNQTIEVLSRGSRFGGLSHSPYASSPFHPTGFGPGIGATYGSPMGVESVLAANFANAIGAGLSHSGVGTPTSFGSPFGTPFGYSPFNTPSYPVAIDPFVAQRGLGHTSFGATPWQPWSPMAEMARREQLAQAMAARQSVLEAMVRATGIPV